MHTIFDILNLLILILFPTFLDITTNIQFLNGYLLILKIQYFSKNNLHEKLEMITEFLVKIIQSRTLKYIKGSLFSIFYVNHDD